MKPCRSCVSEVISVDVSWLEEYSTPSSALSTRLKRKNAHASVVSRNSFMWVAICSNLNANISFYFHNTKKIKQKLVLCHKNTCTCDMMTSQSFPVSLPLQEIEKTMNTLTVTSHKKVDCSPGDVIINLLSQLLMVVLLKILSDTFGMVEAFCAGLAYVILIMVSGCNTIPFFFYGKPAVALATIFTYVALGIRCSTITFYFQEYVNLQALTIWMNQWGFHVVREEAYTSGLILFVALGVITQLLGVILFTAFVARHINKIVFYIL